MFSEKEEVGEQQSGIKDGSFATLRLRSLRATLRGSRDSDDRTARKSDNIRKATQVLGAKVGIDQNRSKPIVPYLSRFWGMKIHIIHIHID